MGYSTSKVTLNSQIASGNLDSLAMGQGCRWVVPNGDASFFAYKIREALYIANLFPQDYPSLANAAETFTIEVIDNHTVQARLARQSTEASITAAEPARTTGLTHGLERAGKAISSAGPQSEFTVIDTWQKAQPTTDPIHFPEADLSGQQLTNLYTWACNWKPPLMILVSGAGLTLGLADPAVLEYAWKPIEERMQDAQND